MQRMFPRDLRTATVDGTDIAYVERGAGAPLVLVHGTNQDLRTWHGQLLPFADGFRTIAYSRRYARPNEDIPAGHDDPMAQHVDDLAALLIDLDAAPAHLVGSSWGGFISLLLAMRRPELVRSIVVCEPPVVPLLVSNPPRAAELLRTAARNPVDAFRVIHFGVRVIEPARRAYERGDEHRGHRIFATALLGKRYFEQLPEDRASMIEENRSVERAQLLGAGFPPLRREEVRRVAAPALVLSSDASSPLFRFTLTRELARLLPNARAATVRNASHMMHEDNPGAFNAAVLDFLNEVGAAASR